MTGQKDGSLVAEFELGNTKEIKRWVMSFGRHAVVEEPSELRAEIREELASLRAAYGNAPERIGQLGGQPD